MEFEDHYVTCSLKHTMEHWLWCAVLEQNMFGSVNEQYLMKKLVDFAYRNRVPNCYKLSVALLSAETSSVCEVDRPELFRSVYRKAKNEHRHWNCISGDRTIKKQRYAITSHGNPNRGFRPNSCLMLS
jgi:hypothetical protein